MEYLINNHVVEISCTFNCEKLLSHFTFPQSQINKKESYLILANGYKAFRGFQKLTHKNKHDIFVAILNKQYYMMDYNGNSLEDLYAFLLENKCTNCNKQLYGFKTNFTDGLVEKRIRKVCSKKCQNEILSKQRMGENNPNFGVPQSKENKLKASIRVKNAILTGKWKPGIGNSKRGHWIDVEINNTKKRVRSSWEAYFWIVNPNLHYEKLRIKYFDKETNKERIYIVDFIDYENKKIYEIGFSGDKKTLTNLCKFEKINEYIKENGYEFHLIDESYFKNNIDLDLLEKQPNKKTLIKRLKQFL